MYTVSREVDRSFSRFGISCNEFSKYEKLNRRFDSTNLDISHMHRIVSGFVENITEIQSGLKALDGFV